MRHNTFQKEEQNDQLVTSNEQQIISKFQESFFWDYSPYPPIAIKTQILLYFSKEQDINYIFVDGQIIKINSVNDIQERKQNLENLELIKYLEFQGKSEDSKKLGRWIAFWNGEILKEIGGCYSNKGLKEGLWKELNKSYHKQVEIYEAGVYFNNKRIGFWKYLFENKQIGGGSYNNFGQKNGKWIEISKNFQKTFQVTHNGEYKKGIKVGIWNIVQQDDEKLQLMIGYGSYDYRNTYSNSFDIKIGLWYELSEDFWNSVYIIYKGEYNYGKKIGKWEIYYKQYQNQPFEQIGGGFYDQMQNDKGKEIQIGKWIELSDFFSNQSQVIYRGEYKNGLKIGKWDICFRNYYYQPFQQIGGGSYDENPVVDNEIKIGAWIEVNHHFTKDRQVIYQGNYQNGKKYGIWKVINKIEYGFIDKIEQMGNEIYDCVQGYKMGVWTELSNIWNKDNVFLQKGEYKENKKVGFWGIYWKWEKYYKHIGGGSYTYIQGCDYGIKKGKWIECSENFARDRQVIYKGEYNNGKKIGRWDIQYRRMDRFEQIGGGLYDEIKGKKIGEWIEVSDSFCQALINLSKNQIFYKGEYENGIKKGKWEQMERYKRYYEFYKIVKNKNLQWREDL